MSVNSFQVIPDILQVTDMIAVVPHRMVLTNNDLNIILPLPRKYPALPRAWPGISQPIVTQAISVDS